MNLNVERYQQSIAVVKSAILALRGQNTIEISDKLQNLFKQLEVINECIPINERNIYLKQNVNLLEAMQHEDYVLMADILEVYFLRMFSEELLKEVSKGFEIGKTEEKICMADGIFVENTAAGYWTLSINGKYLHSNCDPVQEASLLASKWYNPQKECAFVWGIGLGYHVQALAECDKYQRIFVFEPNSTILKAYEKYGVCEMLANTGRVEVIYDPEGINYSRISKAYPETTLFIHYPTLSAMENGKLKNAFLNYNAKLQSIEVQRNQFAIAFRQNKMNNYKLFSEFAFADKKKRAFIIAAGPSLDNNFMELKKALDTDAIIATAPTLRKLFTNGINIDCIVITDTKDELIRLHNGAEQSLSPLIFTSTASPSFVAAHKGEKVMLLQEGFEAAEKLAKEKNEPLFTGSGSVAITALSIAIKKGFEEIVFVGQDLCYLGNKMHASDTSKDFVQESENREHAKDIHDRDVTIPLNLGIFKTEIESIIKKNPHICFLNATEGGLHIAGTKDVVLRELF